jgi:hypothetical protein
MSKNVGWFERHAVILLKLCEDGHAFRVKRGKIETLHYCRDSRLSVA